MKTKILCLVLCLVALPAHALYSCKQSNLTGIWMDHVIDSTGIVSQCKVRIDKLGNGTLDGCLNYNKDGEIKNSSKSFQFKADVTGSCVLSLIYPDAFLIGAMNIVPNSFEAIGYDKNGVQKHSFVKRSGKWNSYY